MALTLAMAPRVLVIAVCLGVSVSAQDAGVLRVTHPHRALAPGQVTLVTVAADRPLTRVEGDALGRMVRFWPAGSPDRWQGFVAVPLDTAPGVFTVTVHASDASAHAYMASLQLGIQDKKFETRQLRVSTQFVDPPQAEMQRIERETKLLASTFAGVGTERLWRGAFAAPVPGRATSSFGRLSVFNGEPRGRHQGADYSAATGTRVRAPNAGRVAVAQDLYFSGGTVIIDHGGGLFSLLAHLSRIDVHEGDIVTRGGIVGRSGATGRVTGPHLHWAVRLGDVSVDPQSLIAAVAAYKEAPEPASP